MSARDPHLDEQLSRFLDDDLEPDEQHALAARLDAEPDLRARVESLRRLQAAVTMLAEHEQPPAALDRLVAPHILERAAARGRRRWLHALAAAATVAIAAGIGLQIARIGPRGGSETVLSSREATPTPFQLAPMPTEDLGDRELGASTRLTQTPPSDPPIDPPLALEPAGPFDAAPEEAQEEHQTATPDVEPERRRKEQPPPKPVATPSSGRWSERVSTGSAVEGAGSPTQPVADELRTEVLTRAAAPQPQKSTRSARSTMVRVQLQMTGSTAIHSATAQLTIAPGSSWPVRITIDADGTVQSVATTSSPTPAALQSIVGARFTPPIAAGTHTGQLTVTSPQPTSTPPTP